MVSTDHATDLMHPFIVHIHQCTSHCNEEAALSVGHEAAKYLLEQAGDDFLDGYYKQ